MAATTQEGGNAPARRSVGERFRPPQAAAIWIATALLFLLSLAVQPQSVSTSSLAGMLPFAAILAVIAAHVHEQCAIAPFNDLALVGVHAQHAAQLPRFAAVVAVDDV